MKLTVSASLEKVTKNCAKYVDELYGRGYFGQGLYINLAAFNGQAPPSKIKITLEAPEIKI